MLVMTHDTARGKGHRFHLGDCSWALGKVFGFFFVCFSRKVARYWNELPGEVVGSLFLQAFKIWLDKAMARDDLVLAGDWTTETSSQYIYD